MADRGIDGDHQVQILDRSRGVEKVLDPVAKVDQPSAQPQFVDLLRRLPQLQAVEADLLHGQQGQQLLQADASALVNAADVAQLELRAAGPDQPHFGGGDAGKSRRPPCAGFGGTSQVGHSRRDGVQGRAEQLRQAQHFDLPVEALVRVLRKHLVDAGAVAEQPRQGLRTLHRHTAAAFLAQGRITHELQDVAQSLLAADQQCLTRKRTSVPAPDAALRHLAPAAGAEAAFVQRPGFRIASLGQEHQGFVEFGIRPMRPDQQGPIVACDGVIQPLHRLQHAARIHFGLREGGLQPQRLFKPVQGFVQLPLLEIQHADLVGDVGIVGR